MEQYWYRITFEVNNRSVDIYAACEKDAKILAQADQIHKGNRYDDLKEIKRID